MFISCDFALFLAINLSCVTFNVRGLNNECKRRQVFRWLHGRKFHIIFLQEVYSSRDIEKIWSAEWGGKVVFVTAQNIVAVLLSCFTHRRTLMWNMLRSTRGAGKFFCALKSMTTDSLLSMFMPQTISKPKWNFLNL